MERKLSRRAVLRGAFTAAALIPVVNLSSKQAWASAEKVSEDDPVARALRYVEDVDGSDIDRPERAGVPGEEQYCYNCSLYIGDDEWGPCTILQNRLVAGKGWCDAWAPRA